jgi:orotidine-5'-phosphate decarboxylase
LHLTENPNPRLIIALDFPTPQQALALTERLDPALCRLKVGKELFVMTGPAFIKQLTQRGFDIFLDLKFHDIPNTVAAACQAVAELGVWMLSVHALGGRRMLEAARTVLEKNPHRPLLIAVTVLTSLEQADLREIGIAAPPEQQVLRLARLVRSVGLDGVVCSAREVALLRNQVGKNFRLVTPGIRLTHFTSDDQRRIMTPREAIEAGSDYLVIGRPVSRASDPLAVLQEINKQISCI